MHALQVQMWLPYGLSGSMGRSSKSVLLIQQLAARYSALLHAYHARLQAIVLFDDGIALHLSHLWHVSAACRSAASSCVESCFTIDIACTNCQAANRSGVPDYLAAVPIDASAEVQALALLAAMIGP